VALGNALGLLVGIGNDLSATSTSLLFVSSHDGNGQYYFFFFFLKF
jgi:hypothetical protein